MWLHRWLTVTYFIYTEYLLKGSTINLVRYFSSEVEVRAIRNGISSKQESSVWSEWRNWFPIWENVWSYIKMIMYVGNTINSLHPRLALLLFLRENNWISTYFWIIFYKISLLESGKNAIYYRVKQISLFYVSGNIFE